MKTLLLILLSISIHSNEFKKERTSYHSPLSYSVNAIEKARKRGFTITANTIINKVNAIEKLNKTNSKNMNWKIKISNLTGSVSSISGDRTIKTYDGDIDDAAKKFISENEELLKVDTASLKIVSKASFMGNSSIYYIQTYNGYDVEFSYVKINRNPKNEITYYSSRYYENINLKTQTKITIEEAERKIKSELPNFSISTYTIVIYPDDLKNSFHLAYKIEGHGGFGIKNGRWVYYIDSQDSNILFKYDSRQYACTLTQETTGTIKAYVFEISPIPTGDPQGSWVPPVLRPIKDIYVFAGSYQSSATTKSDGESDGEYCIDYDGAENGAKVFFTTLGPYLSVVDYQANNLFYTNASYQIKSSPSALQIYSYNPNSTLTYTIAPSLNLGSGTLAFITPFFSWFNIGDIDEYGNSTDADVVYITEPQGNRISAFIGQNKTNFTAGYIPATSYNIKLVSDNSASGSFNITASTYIVITNPTPKDNSTGSFSLPLSPMINAFYHLTAIRDFIMKFNTKCLGNCIDLNRRVPVNVNIYSGNTPVYNAFYDLKHDAIYIGRGPTENDRNFAWDGTIIRHEYIHLVMNRIYPIIYFGEFGAITEALSDYFSLASFWDEGKNINILGNFLGIGEGVARDLSTITKKMPDDWTGEVHADGEILSSVLYKLAKDPSYSLGTFSSGGFAGLKKSDVYAFGAMFYFPDSFEGFMEAMIDLCRNIEAAACEENKIRSAFAAHGITSDYIIVDPYEPNNGPAYAVDISSFSSLKAYIDYSGDEDYYAVSLGKGIFHLKVELPKHPIGLYHAYSIFLFDSLQNPIIYQMPQTKSDLCYPSYNPEYSNICLTRDSYNEFYYYISTPGVYYVSVTAGLNSNSEPGPDYDRNNPYILSYDGQINSEIKIEKRSAVADADVFEFEIKVPKFYYNGFYISDYAWQNGEIFKFCEKECIKMLDFQLKELSTNYIDITDINDNSGNLANYYIFDPDGNPVIKGKIKFHSYGGKTFSQTYPYVGTIYFKFFAENHMFEVGPKNNNYIFLGIAKNIHLTGSSNDIVSYNNIITPQNSQTLIKLETINPSKISVKIYTATGMLVKTLYDGQLSGKMTIAWDGTDDKGKKVPSGIYYMKTEGAVNKIEKIGIVR